MDERARQDQNVTDENLTLKISRDSEKSVRKEMKKDVRLNRLRWFGTFFQSDTYCPRETGWCITMDLSSCLGLTIRRVRSAYSQETERNLSTRPRYGQSVDKHGIDDIDTDASGQNDEWVETDGTISSSKQYVECIRMNQSYLLCHGNDGRNSDQTWYGRWHLLIFAS